MKSLVCGAESRARIELLISLTSIKSEGIKEALKNHYVNGMSESAAAAFEDVKQPNLKAAMLRLEEVAEVVEKIKDLDWAHLKDACTKTK